jgi:hypothetical protein
MATDFEILRRIYNCFDPFYPLPANNPMYVNCSAVRGDENILTELGNEILLSDRTTKQLYTGHRGAGKSTELLRLQHYLEENGFKVVYFPVDQDDMDIEDAQYTDILLACTRHLFKELNPPEQNPIWTWARSPAMTRRSNSNPMMLMPGTTKRVAMPCKGRSILQSIP